MGLVPQPAVEDTGRPAITESTDGSGRSRLAVSFSYTLCRSPDDHADPVNLKHLGPEERAAIEAVPPWPRPAWLIEHVEMMRYPQVWEVMRTCWTRDDSEYRTQARQLVDHANYILMNQFREELGLAPGPTEDGPWKVRSSPINAVAAVEIDGEVVPALEIDTDPFVYAIGAHVRPDVVTTIAIARDLLPYIRLALRTRTSPAL